MPSRSSGSRGSAASAAVKASKASDQARLPSASLAASTVLRSIPTFCAHQGRGASDEEVGRLHELVFAREAPPPSPFHLVTCCNASPTVRAVRTRNESLLLVLLDGRSGHLVPFERTSQR